MNTKKGDMIIFNRPPWSNQPVKMWIRVLAWIWVILLVFLTAVLVWMIIPDKIPQEDILNVLGVVAGELYMTLLFAHVAIRGRAPAGWIPWDV